MPIPDPAVVAACASDDDTRILARCILAEAEGEPWLGKVAVGYSVLNRKRWIGRYPNSIRQVILQRAQYEGMGPNRAKATIDPDKYSATAWGECLRAASAVLCGAVQDPTGISATHYVTTALLNSPAAPGWAKLPGIKSRVVGRQTFFQDGRL